MNKNHYFFIRGMCLSLLTLSLSRPVTAALVCQDLFAPPVINKVKVLEGKGFWEFWDNKAAQFPVSAQINLSYSDVLWLLSTNKSAFERGTKSLSGIHFDLMDLNKYFGKLPKEFLKAGADEKLNNSKRAINILDLKPEYAAQLINNFIDVDGFPERVGVLGFPSEEHKKAVKQWKNDIAEGLKKLMNSDPQLMNLQVEVTEKPTHLQRYQISLKTHESSNLAAIYNILKYIMRPNEMNPPIVSFKVQIPNLNQNRALQIARTSEALITLYHWLNLFEGYKVNEQMINDRSLDALADLYPGSLLVEQPLLGIKNFGFSETGMPHMPGIVNIHFENGKAVAMEFNMSYLDLQILHKSLDQDRFEIKEFKTRTQMAILQLAVTLAKENSKLKIKISNLADFDYHPNDAYGRLVGALIFVSDLLQNSSDSKYKKIGNELRNIIKPFKFEREMVYPVSEEKIREAIEYIDKHFEILEALVDAGFYLKQ